MMTLLKRLFASRLLILLAFLGFAGLACVALGILLYNLVYSLARLAELFDFQSPLPGLASIPPAVQPLMQDLSGVSPALSAYTLLAMAVGAIRLLPRSGGRFAGPRFPFPANYKAYFVQIGLLGTIIGFVIAFASLDPGSRGQAEILLAALGTALWSTLTALLLAYVVGPLAELVFQWWLKQRTGYDPHLDTLSAVDGLRRQVVGASDALQQFALSLDSLSLEMETLQLQNRLARLEQELRAFGYDLASLDGSVGALNQSYQDWQMRLLALEQRERERELRLQDLSTRHNGDAARFKGIDTRLDKLEARLSKLLKDLQQVFD